MEDEIGQFPDRFQDLNLESGREILDLIAYILHMKEVKLFLA